MSKLISNLLFTTLFITNSVYAESINEIAFKASLNAHCEVNKETHKKCLHLSKNECYEIFEKLLPKCSQNKYAFPINHSDIPKLTECLIKGLDETLTSRGINLDEPCSK